MNSLVIYSKTEDEMVFWSRIISELMKQKSIKEWLTLNPSLN